MNVVVQKQPFLDFAGMAVILSVIYNALLAMINAHGGHIGTAVVAGSEALLVTACLGYIALHIRALPNIFPPVIFLLAIILCFILVSVINETLFIKICRDMLLVATFFLMGGVIAERSLIMVFRVLGWLVLIFMLVENYATETYVSIFEPAQYYANTRGMEQSEFNELGIFNASMGYQDRFSFNISHHRLSSIFLEQVSLANFAMLLAIFMATFWRSLKKFDKLFFPALAALIILTTDSRSGSIILLIILAGYFLFPLMPRYTNLMYMPLVLLLGALFFYDPDSYTFGDDLAGRMGNTMHLLANLDTGFFTGSGMENIDKTWDSGYAYIVFSLTIFGLIALWLFASLIVAQDNAQSKRFIHSANIFFFISLMVSGAVFSIKVAALLWVMAGFLYYKRFRNY